VAQASVGKLAITFDQAAGEWHAGGTVR